MAYICDDCKYIFPSKRSSCPFCGRRVYNNTLPEKNLLNDGYSQAPVKIVKENRQDNITPKNPYDDLRQAFFNAQTADSSKNKIPEMSPKTSENISKNDKEKPVSTDYFSQFSSTSNSGIDIPTVEPSPQIHPSDIPPQRASYEQKLEQQRRRLDRQYRQRAALNFISNIRWSAVFRIMFVILLIIVAVTAWKMRYVIFNSIISFIVSILPIIIMIWLLWYIFRSFLG